MRRRILNKKRPSQVMGDVGNGDWGRGYKDVDTSNMRLAIRGFGFGSIIIRLALGLQT
jgi:hypothetical protein